jgi:hypothetical protein
LNRESFPGLHASFAHRKTNGATSRSSG